MPRRTVPVLLPTAALAAALAAIAFTTTPAAADSVSPSTCLSNCTAVFDTAGSTTFTAPPAATALGVTVKGAAGAPAPVSITADPTAVGGPGGNTTVALGAAFAGKSFAVTVGATGGGSSIAESGSLLVVAGGGGGGGYAGLLDQPGKIFATYPGGSGGSPAAPGVAAGSPGAAFGPLSANGGGGTATGGTGGTGDVPGTNGTAPDGTAIRAGGAGGSLLVGAITHTAGAGGSGYAGGGGGAIARNVPNGDTPVDVVAPGGGGSGFLAAGLTATAGTANAGSASVTFTWSFSPTASTTATTVHPRDTVTVKVAGLPSDVAFSAVFDGIDVVSGTSDNAGAATVTFTVAANQKAGSFPVRILVGGAVAASTSPVTVELVAPSTPPTTPAASPTGASLAATGDDISAWLIGGVGLVVVGALLLALQRRRYVARH